MAKSIRMLLCSESNNLMNFSFWKKIYSNVTLTHEERNGSQNEDQPRSYRLPVCRMVTSTRRRCLVRSTCWCSQASPTRRQERHASSTCSPSTKSVWNHPHSCARAVSNLKLKATIFKIVSTDVIAMNIDSTPKRPANSSTISWAGSSKYIFHASSWNKNTVHCKRTPTKCYFVEVVKCRTHLVLALLRVCENDAVRTPLAQVCKQLL